MKSYLERFDHVVLKCPSVPQDNIMLAVHEGLRHERLVKKLVRKLLITYPEFKAKGQEYIKK